MKQKRLSEVRALIGSIDFESWWLELTSSREALGESEKRYDELLGQSTLLEFRAELTQKNAIDTLYKAGEHEDTAATMLAEANELENRSFKGISDFEEQRIRASESWYRLGAAEKKADEVRSGSKPPVEQQPVERALKTAADEYEKENARKARLWDEVERLWMRSAEVSLLVAEQKMLGKKVRREAEGLFAQAEERKLKARGIKTDTDAAAQAVEACKAKRSALLERARELFGCSVGADFLYFRAKDDTRICWCIALIADTANYNVELKPLGIYMVDRARGVTFLEPARAAPPSVEEGDRRFDDYFLKGRKGEARVS